MAFKEKKLRHVTLLFMMFLVFIVNAGESEYDRKMEQLTSKTWYLDFSDVLYWGKKCTITPTITVVFDDADSTLIYEYSAISPCDSIKSLHHSINLKWNLKEDKPGRFFIQIYKSPLLFTEIEDGCENMDIVDSVNFTLRGPRKGVLKLSCPSKKGIRRRYRNLFKSNP